MPFDGLIRPRGNPTRMLPQGRFTLDPRHPLATGLIHLWPLNGDGRDYSQSGNHGTITGGCVPVIGNMGPVLSYNGTSQGVATAFNANNLPSGAFSMSQWVYVPSTPPNLSQFGYLYRGGSGGTRGLLQFSGGIYFHGNNADVISGVAFDTNKWQSIIFTYDATTLTIYKNGVSIASGTPSLTSPTNPIIDINRGDFSTFITGGVALFSGYNRALSPAEVSWLVAEPCGMLIPMRRRAYITIAPSGITGALSATESNDTISAITEAGDALSAAGAALIVGTLSVTETSDTLSAAGGSGSLAALAVTETSDTLSAAGAPLAAGVLSATEAGDALSAAAVAAVRGILALTESPDTLAGTADSLFIAGALALTEASDTLAASARVLVIAALSLADAGDTLHAAGLSGTTSVFIGHIFRGAPVPRRFIGTAVPRQFKGR